MSKAAKKGPIESSEEEYEESPSILRNVWEDPAGEHMNEPLDNKFN